jgi:hypothetical protein
MCTTRVQHLRLSNNVAVPSKVKYTNLNFTFCIKAAAIEHQVKYRCVHLLVRSWPVLKAFVYWYCWDRTIQLLVWVIIIYSESDRF